MDKGMENIGLTIVIIVIAVTGFIIAKKLDVFMKDISQANSAKGFPESDRRKLHGRKSSKTGATVTSSKSRRI